MPYRGKREIEEFVEFANLFYPQNVRSNYKENNLWLLVVVYGLRTVYLFINANKKL